MPDILHRVGIDAEPDAVLHALSTIDGIRGWWDSGANGDASQGGAFEFSGGRMQVVEANRDRVVWRYFGKAQDWVDTEVSFALSFRDGQTYVLFKHADWKEPVEFMHHCSTKWATFLLSLRDLLETSVGHPMPHDVKIAANR